MGDPRSTHTFGQHVRLTCQMHQAVEVMERRWEELVAALQAVAVGVFEVGPVRLALYAPKRE